MAIVTDGELRKPDGQTFRVTLSHSKYEAELIISDGVNVLSAYKKTKDSEKAYKNKDARKLYKLIERGLKGCTSKNGYPSPFVRGTSITHNVSKQGTDFSIEKFEDSICGLELSNDNEYVYMEYKQEGEMLIPKNIPYIKLASSSISYTNNNDDEQEIRVRTLEEIALEKDTTWLNGKKYYVVNDEKTAEQIFRYIENYKGTVSFDTETTGLRINMFGKIGSDRKKQLEKYNEEQVKNHKETIRIDRLVGIIFCIEKDVSYYFPCWNRKFKNLYEDYTEECTNRTINNIKTRYMIGEFRNKQNDMAKFIRETPASEIEPDVILMERVRDILEKCNILAHNGTFEWKVCWLYNILCNLKDDTMIMHQLMYKFRSTTSNRGEPSNLKYLSKVELGVDQLDLKDFFIDFEETGAEVKSHDDGKKKKKKKKLYIDFSYMDYEGSKAYAPADGDLTLQIFFKYKKDMKENHRELEYLYSVEILVSQAIAYMEFYGIRIDEEKIEDIKQKQITEKLKIEHQIREMAGIKLPEEDNWFKQIDNYLEEEKELKDRLDKVQEDLLQITKEKIAENSKARIELQDKIRDKFDSQEDGLNLASPAQVADLFYNKLGLPLKEEKPSVSKKVLKQYLKLMDENGKPKYPYVNLYTDWKKLDTLLTKFFDNLPYYMYPGGFMFASFGQISTATGRMSCSKPNLQQLPKDVTSIVVPREGYVQIDGDFSQIEYRTLVALAPEPALREEFKDPDMDYHTTMASLMYGVDYALVTSKMRGDAKSFNFGIPYGMGFGSLAILLSGVSTDATRAEAREKYELYFKDQPNVRQFFNDVKEAATIHKYTETKWHRRRYYSFEDKDGNFSQAKKAAALRQAGNAVIQGTAADIFKIAVARNFSWIKNNSLIGEVLITNMVHDEQLLEVNATKLNVQKVLAGFVENMEMEIDGFPPLYTGAGVAMNWKEAKGKMAEIHPDLAHQLQEEAKDMPLWLDKPGNTKDVIEYFDNRVYEFRRKKIIDYVMNPENQNKVIHPVIGSLLSLQFDYGVTARYTEMYDNDNYTKEEKEKLLGGIPVEQLRLFIEENNLGIDYTLFHQAQALDEDVEEDNGYEDGEDEENGLDIDEFYDSDFVLIDEDDKLFGVDLQDIIKKFGLMISAEQHICGIDATIISYKQIDKMAEYLKSKECDKEDYGAMQVILLTHSNIINKTDLWVKDIDGSVISHEFGLNSLLYR